MSRLGMWKDRGYAPVRLAAGRATLHDDDTVMRRDAVGVVGGVLNRRQGLAGPRGGKGDLERVIEAVGEHRCRTRRGLAHLRLSPD